MLFLSSPPILVLPKENSTLILYPEVSNKAISYVLVHDNDEWEKPRYFVSKVLKGVRFDIKRLRSWS